jgi:5-methylcytosine-specific restriction endonuclease McrA
MRNYNDPLYKKWRQEIRKRDGSCCQWPNCTARKKLQVHHILPWSGYPGLRYDPNNGITLCKTHHNLIKNDETTYASFFMRLLYNKRTIKKGL